LAKSIFAVERGEHLAPALDDRRQAGLIHHFILPQPLALSTAVGMEPEGLSALTLARAAD
jgi:hypothetical protein